MIHVLNDHKAPKPTNLEAARNEAKKVAEYYLEQVPAFAGKLIEAALNAYDAGRRDEFAAWVAQQREFRSLHPERVALLDEMLDVFGPRKPMPEQPEVQS